MTDAEARFWELCDRAARHDEAHFRKAHRENAPDDEVIAEAEAFERSMVEIIGFVEANPEHRATFVRCFCDLVQWKRSAPLDLVAFCMRRLRFPEVPELIRRDAEAHGRTSAYYIDHMAHWSSINHAYLDEVWEGARRPSSASSVGWKVGRLRGDSCCFRLRSQEENHIMLVLSGNGPR